jgi:hypothetical protein
MANQTRDRHRLAGPPIPRRVHVHGPVRSPMPEPGAARQDSLLVSRPQNAAQSAHNARAGAAHSPASLEIVELKDELKALIREVKDGKVAPGVAAVITQLANTIIWAVEQDRKVRELDEIEERLADLERKIEDGHQRPAA